MTSLIKVTNYLEKTLNQSSYSDASLNGLQIEGSAEISKVCTAVDACLTTIESASNSNADLLFTHHGLFWGKQLPIVSSHKAIVQSAIESNLSLYTSHLPLDAHKEYGNNFVIANKLGLTKLESTLPYGGSPIACIGENSEKNSNQDILDFFKFKNSRYNPRLLDFGPKTPEKVLVLTGSGADALYSYEELGFDTLITGEAKQFAYHFAKDNKLNVIFAGHYNTETFGVKEIGNLLKKEFKIEHEFLDFPTDI